MKLIDKVLGEVCAEAIKYTCDDEGAQFVVNVRAILLPVCEKADAMLRFRTAAEDLGEYAADLDDKLEAIKKEIEEWNNWRDRKIPARGIDKSIFNIKKILDGSEFTTKDEDVYEE